MNNADDFASFRPNYTRDDVEYIEAHAIKHGIPYCRDCHDWHFSADDHSYDPRLDADATK